MGTGEAQSWGREWGVVNGEQRRKRLSGVARATAPGTLPQSRLRAVPVPLLPSRSPLSWACGGHEAERSPKPGPHALLPPSSVVFKRVVVSRPGTSVIEEKSKGKGLERESSRFENRQLYFKL